MLGHKVTRDRLFLNRKLFSRFLVFSRHFQDFRSVSVHWTTQKIPSEPWVSVGFKVCWWSRFKFQIPVKNNRIILKLFGVWFCFWFFLHENTCYIDTLPSLEIYLYFPTPLKKCWTRSDMLCNDFFSPFPKQKIWWCLLLVSRVVVDLDSWSLKMGCASLINMFCFVLYINWKCVIGFG